MPRFSPPNPSQTPIPEGFPPQFSEILNLIQPFESNGLIRKIQKGGVLAPPTYRRAESRRREASPTAAAPPPESQKADAVPAREPPNPARRSHSQTVRRTRY